MIKTILLAIWVCAVALGANFGFSLFKDHRAHAVAEGPKNALDVRKLKEISVPTIRDGVVKGYIVVKVSYVVDVSKIAEARISPDAFVADEVFSYLYSDHEIDYNRLERYDIAKFKNEVINRTNTRLHTKIVSDLSLQEFTYMKASEASR